MTKPATGAQVASPAIAQIHSTHFDREVYEPSDDSFLLVDALVAASSSWKSSPPSLCVEIGSGSGYVISSVALLLAKQGVCAHCIAVDINSAAAHATAVTLQAHRISCVDVIQTDLLTALQPRLYGLIDLLVLNPPYVPTPGEEVSRGGIAAAWAGGHQGRVVIDRVLSQLENFLSLEGHLYMVTVAENDPKGILRDLQMRGFDGGEVLSRQADEEHLSILHVWRRPKSGSLFTDATFSTFSKGA